MIALLKIANHRPCHSPSSEGEGELNICRSRGEEALIKKVWQAAPGGAAISRAVAPTGWLHFCPPSPFPSFHQNYSIKPFQAISRCSKPFQAIFRKKRLFIFSPRSFEPIPVSLQNSGRFSIAYLNLFAPISTYLNHYDPLNFFGWSQRKPVSFQSLSKGFKAFQRSLEKKMRGQVKNLCFICTNLWLKSWESNRRKPKNPC